MEQEKRFTLRLSQKDYELIKSKAQQEKRSLNQFISYHLVEMIESQ